jgi:outer membrane protein assembly factor BamB
MQGSSLGAITSQAALYPIDKESIVSGRVDGPSANPGRNQRQLLFNRVATNDKGNFIAINSERGSQLAYYDPAAPVDRKLIVIASPGGEAKPSGDPVWLSDGVAIPLNSGQLVAVDPSTGATIGSPIQPPLEPGHSVQWATPTLLADGSTLVAANSDNILLKIATGKQFNKLQEVNTANKVSGNLASLKDIIFVPTVGEQASYVEVYGGSDLARQNAVAIEGKMPWGLYAVGDVVIAYSNLEGFVAIGADGQKRWATPLKNIAPVGKPQLIDNHIVIACFTGEIYRINPQDGQIDGIIRTGETISSQPLFVNKAMFVPGDDGNVLVVTSVSFTPYEPASSN